MRSAYDAARAVRRRRLITYASGVSVALMLSLIFMGLIGRSTLQSARVAADEQRAQVRLVIERQETGDRVAIEKRRYDELAATYNREADSITGSWAARFFSLDKELPLSSEVDGW
ncbi:MAG TPA: hypothetical protein VML75_24225 [Kofleriaceae bacterium]|nr:hypothetical protein [Kofleriaceae bacterium]